MTHATCTIDGCDRTQRGGARGMCKMHWTRWRRHGDPLHVAGARTSPPAGPHGPECAVPRCDRLAPLDEELCVGHADRLDRLGQLCPDVPLGQVSRVAPTVDQLGGGDWPAHAVCRDMPLDLFFARDPTPALQICVHCPVQIACYDDAVDLGDVHAGVRGGATPTGRRRRARRREAVAA